MKIYSDSFYYHCTLHQSNRSLPYLLMLHGFMGSEKVFDHLINDLKKFCNPITIDLAGHGKTKSPESSDFYTTERQVRQLHSIIQRFHFNNLYLYGYSMGGRLAFQNLASHPDLFSGVIVESSHCGIQSKKERAKRKKIDENRAKQIADNFDGFIDQWMNLPLFLHTPSRMKSVYEAVMRKQNPKTICASLRAFGADSMPPICDQIKKSTVPLTLIAGEKDQKYMGIMKSIKNECETATLNIIKDAGHRVHASQPTRLIEIMRDTISGK